MNFYARFPGDYGRDTADLSLAEHGAYALLLDSLYSTERPLPSNPVGLYRVARAFSEDEQRAVDTVVGRYFKLTADGYINERAMIEIDSARVRIDAARINGSKGGRPKKTAQEKPTGFPPGSDQLTQQQPTGEALHTHIPTTDVVGSGAPKSRGTRKCPSDFLVTDAMWDWAGAKAPAADVELETAKFRDHTFKQAITDWPGAWRNWLRGTQERANERRQARPGNRHSAAGAAIFDEATHV